MLATAVTELYPGVKVSIGPPIEDGFYYDFEFPEGVSVSEHDLERIEERMREHVKADEAFERSELPAAEAIERFRGEGQDYKVELIEDLVRDQGVDTVSLYRNGPFTDLCRGPHGPSTKRIEAFKLTSVAGAYWRGDSSRKMLTRIYGTAFLSKADLEEHLRAARGSPRARPPQARPRAGAVHALRRGAGHAVLAPKGTHIWNELTSSGARATWSAATPRCARRSSTTSSSGRSRGTGTSTATTCTSRTSRTADGPQADELPGPRPDLQARPALLPRPPDPLRRAGRWCTATSRAERSTACCGCGSITQDDAHVFCTEEQIEEEVLRCLDFGFFIYDQFGLEPRLELSTRPEKRVGTEEMWDRAEDALHGALESRGLEYDLNEGDGAFYGPKIDLHMTDTIGRSWQLGTVQLDYYMPEQFELTYTGADNADHRPAMIHRALMGAFERFIGILIEHYAGEFPLWLAPVQAIVLPIADRHVPYAHLVDADLRRHGVRARSTTAPSP